MHRSGYLFLLIWTCLMANRQGHALQIPEKTGANSIAILDFTLIEMFKLLQRKVKIKILKFVKTNSFHFQFPTFAIG